MKLKNHSGAKKRIRISKRGKLMSQKPCKRHLLINKSKRQKSLNNRGMAIHHGDQEKLRRLLPY